MKFSSEEFKETIEENKRLKKLLKEKNEKIDIQEELLKGYKNRKQEYQKIIIKKAITYEKVLNQNKKQEQEETEEEEDCL